ncbi:SAF domain-containing protein [Brevibacterium sp. JNUCC-42]|nr:SAF domain-containing protein [Brevibacterium sp. JNUCC-42]
MKKKTLLLICIASFLLALGCFYAATKYINKIVHETMYAPVIKVAQGKQLEPFQPISRADIIIEQEQVDEIQLGAIQSMEEVLGKQSVQTIYSGEQILIQKLRDGYLLPEPGKARYELPITAMMPVTEMRKGDHVKVWLRYKTTAELEILPKPTHFPMKSISADLLFTSQLVTVKDSNGFEIYTIQPQILPDAGNMTKTFFHGSQTTPLDEMEKRYWDYRAQPSAVAAFVGFNLTDQQYLILIEALQYGTIQIGREMLKGGKGY